MSQQIFPIIDPETNKIIGKKSRLKVHVDGDWHWGIQANIIRFKNHKPEILVQERSELVDISSRKLDQSLATQMLVEDKGDRLKTLIRGLNEELGISLNLDRDMHKIIELGQPGSFRISKTYKENSDLYNKEVSSLFFIFTDQIEISPRSPRVKKTYWLPIDDFEDLISINPNKFTKTARSYFINEDLYQYIQLVIEKFNQNQIVVRELPFKSEYYSYNSFDVAINNFSEGYSSVRVYSCLHSMKLIEEIKQIKDFTIKSDRHGIEITSPKGNLKYYNEQT